MSLKEQGTCVSQDMESEYETDSEDEQLGCRLIKPVFVPQNEREVCRYFNTSRFEHHKF